MAQNEIIIANAVLLQGVLSHLPLSYALKLSCCWLKSLKLSTKGWTVF